MIMIVDEGSESTKAESLLANHISRPIAVRDAKVMPAIARLNDLRDRVWMTVMHTQARSRYESWIWAAEEFQTFLPDASNIVYAVGCWFTHPRKQCYIHIRLE